LRRPPENAPVKVFATRKVFGVRCKRGDGSAAWACGLAVIGGHLVIGAERPGWLRARVRALSSPGASPVPLDVVAAGEDPGGLLRWEIADVSGH
jgi:hypothetical protein